MRANQPTPIVARIRLRSEKGVKATKTPRIKASTPISNRNHRFHPVRMIAKGANTMIRVPSQLNSRCVVMNLIQIRATIKITPSNAATRAITSERKNDGTTTVIAQALCRFNKSAIDQS